MRDVILREEGVSFTFRVLTCRAKLCPGMPIGDTAWMMKNGILVGKGRVVFPGKENGRTHISSDFKEAERQRSLGFLSEGRGTLHPLDASP